MKRKPFYKRLKFAIPIAVIILLGLFMILTPTGHALANNVYTTVVQWFNDSINIHHGTNDTPIATPIVAINYFDSIENVQTEMDMEFAYNLKANQDGKIEVIKEESITKIITKYIYKSSNITVTQTIFDYNTEWDSNIQFGDGEAIDITIDNKIRFIGYVQNGSGYAIAYIDNISVDIYSERVDYNNLLSFIKSLKID